ncbi:HTH-type transcriptional regulator GltR [bacterium HR40]|nr:HTH-type transcriptional regulator GltR [bacterium HR40]
MPRLLDPELLRSFVAMADHGSLSAAASRVGRSQSALSMQMQRLEETVGRTLFRRRGRGLELTADGLLLLEHARRILRVHAEALAAFADDPLSGDVRIGAPDDYASSFLPRILARFAESHPRVRVELVCEPSPQLLPRLAAGSLDLALITRGSGEREGELLHREPVVWVGSARHEVHLEDPLPLACFAADCCFRRAATERLTAIGRRYRIAYTSLSVAGIYAALDAGLAIAPVTANTLRPGFRILGEREGLPPLPPAEILLLDGPSRDLPAIARLREHIRESFARPAPRPVAA